MKILHSADWHINLHKKKVPVEWSANRFRLFFNELHRLEKNHDVHFLSGDIFDRKPEPDEICLFLRFANAATIPTFIIPGNHEATKRGETFLEHFHEDYAITNPNVVLITKNQKKEVSSQYFQFSLVLQPSSSLLALVLVFSVMLKKFRRGPQQIK